MSKDNHSSMLELLDGIKGDINGKRNIKTQHSNRIIHSKSEPKLPIRNMTSSDYKDRKNKFVSNAGLKLIELSVQSPSKFHNKFSIIESNRDVLSMNKIKGRGELFPIDKNNMNEQR